MKSSFPKEFIDAFEIFKKALLGFESQSLQQRWINKGSHHRHPFELLDLLGDTAEALISKTPEAMSAALTAFVIDIASERSANFRGFPEQKLRKFSIEIFAVYCSAVI